MMICCACASRKCFDELADELPERLDRARRALAQGRIELGESRLDLIEIGRLGGKITHGCADSLDHFAHIVDLGGAQVVHEGDVALLERRGHTCST